MILRSPHILHPYLNNLQMSRANPYSHRFLSHGQRGQWVFMGEYFCYLAAYLKTKFGELETNSKVKISETCIGAPLILRRVTSLELI